MLGLLYHHAILLLLTLIATFNAPIFTNAILKNMMMKNMMMKNKTVTKKRKKVCPCCGRKLWLRDFYRNSDGSVSSWCKDCTKRNKKEWYHKNRKVPDGIRHDSSGRLIEHKGLSRKIFWSKQMLDDLRRLYATTKNEDLADILGVSMRTVIRKARELGLQKDPVWQHGNTMRHLKMMQLENMVHGIKSPFQKGVHYSPETEFKPGHQESHEVKAKRIASVKEWYRKHPFAAKKKAAKALETRKLNSNI